MVLLTGKLLCVLGESSLGQGSIISTPNFMGGQLSWLEHLPYKQGVTGSSPVSPTIKTHTAILFIMLTVNLLTIKTSLVISGSSSDGRTPDLGSGGRRFKSCLSDHIDTYSKFKDIIFMLLVQIQLCKHFAYGSIGRAKE